jgi:FAD/FMN-containing dehydrogenase
MADLSQSSGSKLGRALEASAVAELAAGFAGELIQPADAGYDTARAVFNAMIDRRPALIARCTGDADVVAAVNFARAQELLVAVRAGGHSVPGYGVCDGGIVIDVAPMKGIWVDPDQGVARAQSGLTWGEFDRETQLHGRPSPAGGGPRPASPVRHWAAAADGSSGSSGSPATTSWRPRS